MLSIKKDFYVFIIVISTLITSNALIAADFTFNVPVKLSNLSEKITNAYVECKALRFGVSYVPIVIGHGRSTESVVNGALDKIFVISFNSSGTQSARKNPAAANRWNCSTKICNSLNTCEVLNETPASAHTPTNIQQGSEFHGAPDVAVVMEKTGGL